MTGPAGPEHLADPGQGHRRVRPTRADGHAGYAHPGAAGVDGPLGALLVHVCVKVCCLSLALRALAAARVPVFFLFFFLSAPQS